MKKNLQIRLLVIVALAAVSAISFWMQGINLGLDLQGGIHLVLQVETQEALTEEVNQVRDRLEAVLQDEQIPFSQATVDDELRIEIRGVPADRSRDARRALETSAVNWTLRSQPGENGVDFILEIMAAARKALLDLTVRQVREIIQNRVDQYGVAEPSISVYGSGDVQDQIILELPGVEDFDRVIDIIQNTAKLELKMVHPDGPREFESEAAARAAFSGGFPDDQYEIVRLRDRTTGPEPRYMVVRKAAAITGQHLKNAFRSEDPLTGASEVSFFLNSEGVQLFSDVTGRNVGGYLAIVLDGEIRSAPRIESKINTESARITGNFTADEADDLALVLRSGALPASIVILENRSVGPSLGLDSIRSGVSASLLGLVLVVVGMLVVYRFSGVNAVICLVLNLVFLLGALAYLGAALTLPGIAGIILTIGMAVDANILIFERIKEELRRRKGVNSAVDDGFNKVFSTIIDTNTTTLVAAAFLFQFGTGPIRGFAVTLAIGLLANLFTATFVSKTLFRVILGQLKVERLSI